MHYSISRAVCLQMALVVVASIAAADSAVIGGVAYDAIDGGEPFAEFPPPAQSWRPPNPFAAERRASLMAFVADDPGEYIPKRVPRDKEHVKALSVFVSQGETACFSVGLHALKKLEGLSASVDFGVAPVSAELRHMHCWPQRTGWKSRKWYITPELLLPFSDDKRVVPAQEIGRAHV